MLHGLESSGALRSRRKTVSGRSRIYYSVSAAGLRRLAELSATWSNLTAAIQKVLTGAQYGEAIEELRERLCGLGLRRGMCVVIWLSLAIMWPT